MPVVKNHFPNLIKVGNFHGKKPLCIVEIEDLLLHSIYVHECELHMVINKYQANGNMHLPVIDKLYLDQDR